MRRATAACRQLAAWTHISIHALREEGDADRLEITTHCAISIHALREEGDLQEQQDALRHQISIHALREEGDDVQASLRDFMRISIHALREEGDVSSDGQLTRPPIFLSTPSARRATTQVRGTEIRSEISIHALREEGDVCFAHMIFRLLVISIHALREEGDQCTFLNRRERQHFYPRPPRGGRPIEGGQVVTMDDFYPRPPRGGRPVL